MKKLVKKGIIIISIVFSYSVACHAGTNLEFALKLAKKGYPELGIKYLEKESIKTGVAKEGVNTIFCEIELLIAKSSLDLQSRTEHAKKAASYSKGLNRTSIENANFNYSLANLLGLGLKEPSLSENQRLSINSEVIPYFEEAKKQYKIYIDTNLTKFEEFTDLANGEKGSAFLASPIGINGFKSIYSPYVTSAMRYFECVAEKANLIPKNDASRIAGLEKIIDEADTLSYLMEAPIPSVAIGTQVARIYGILADSGVNAKDNLEKAQEKFKEVLLISSTQTEDRERLRMEKSKTINSMMELAMRNSDHKSALEAVDRYLVSGRDTLLPIPGKFVMDDFEVLLNGILVNANLSKSDENARDKFQRNIDKIKMILENAIPRSNSSVFWKKKLNSYMAESAMIMGQEISDPLLLIQLADDKKNEGNYQEAIKLYEKALAGKFVGSEKLNKKPGVYNSLAFCASKINDNELGLRVMDAFFNEFSPSDSKNSSLKEVFEKSSQNYYKLANAVYAVNKTETNKANLGKALQILETFNLEGAIFIKIDAFSKAGNFIDAISLADTIKKDARDYDKAIYLKSLALYYYSKDVKSKNENRNNVLSVKLAMESNASFQVLLAFLKSDTTEIIQAKKISRTIWEKEAKKLIAFNLLAMDDYKNAAEALNSINEEYKNNADDIKHMNRFYVLKGILTSYAKLYNLEKDSNVKQKFISKSVKIFNELEALDSKAFPVTEAGKSAENSKNEIVNNQNVVVGLMQFSNPLKDPVVTAEGVERINKGSKDKPIDNKDLFFADKFKELQNYESAANSYAKVLKAVEGKGWNLPLRMEDFASIKNKFISDESRTFFRLNFENYAIPPQNAEGKEIQKNTRNYGRLRKNLEYVIGLDPNVKIDEVNEKAIQERIQSAINKDKTWNEIKASGELTKIFKKLNDFQKYLDIVENLYECNLNTKQFEEAIKYSEIFRANCPGFSEDKKMADLKYEFGKSLMNDKVNQEKSLSQIKEALKMYYDMKARVNLEKFPKLAIDLNEKRLICSAMIYKLSKEQKVLEEIFHSLRLMYLNQEDYIKYVNLFSELENMGQLPDDLKPMSPEQIRIKNEANEKRDKDDKAEMIRQKDIAEKKILDKRNAGSVGADYSFLHIEMRDLDSAKLELFNSYYEKIKGVPPLKTNPDESDLLDAFNVILRKPELFKAIPSEIFNIKEIINANLIKEIESILVNQGAKAEGTTPIISLNRKILEVSFPLLPKIGN